jgi:hypothetical protein
MTTAGTMEVAVKPVIQSMTVEAGSVLVMFANTVTLKMVEDVKQMKADLAAASGIDPEDFSLYVLEGSGMAMFPPAAIIEDDVFDVLRRGVEIDVDAAAGES